MYFNSSDAWHNTDVVILDKNLFLIAGKVYQFAVAILNNAARICFVLYW